MSIVNALTIDFEDWFCVTNLSESIKYEDWQNCELRIENNTSRILELFDKHDVKATFFVLGWIAERLPELIKLIDMCGHEIASHGYSHISINKLTRSEFEADLKKALQIKKNIINKKILGFRSPSFSINSKTLWAYEIMLENGIKYDSSVFPFSFHPEYGFPGSIDTVHEPIAGLLEVPLNVAKIFGVEVPFGGGGYFRLYPYFFSRMLMNRYNKNGRPFIFYLHPWEIDIDQPRVMATVTKKFRHYYNIKNNFNKFEKVIENYEFTTVQKLINIL